MSELLPITIASVVLAALSHFFSEYDPIRCRYGQKERLWYVVLSVVLVLFVGLRTGYNDTYNYTGFYKTMSSDTGLFENFAWELGENPGFELTNRILVRLGFSAQSFLMFYAVITVGIYLWFLRKYACNLPMTMFLFVTFGGFTFTMAAIKQCMAMALCMVAVDRALHRKYISFAFWILLAMHFHPYAMMYAVVPFLIFRPWSVGTVLMLGVFAIAGIIMESLVGTIVDITDLLGESYDSAAFLGEGVNPLRVAAVAVPILLALVTRTEIAKERDRAQYLMVNLAMLNAEIMFVGLFGTANYFARLANYFLPFQTLAVPWLITHFEPKSKKLVTWAAVAGYGLFFVYSYAIAENFDSQYASVSLWSYLKSLF